VSSLSLFLPLVLPSLGVFSLAGSFRCPFLHCVLAARFMLLGSFLRGFSVKTFFLIYMHKSCDPVHRPVQACKATQRLHVLLEEGTVLN
jgi:hypothetical protein